MGIAGGHSLLNFNQNYVEKSMFISTVTPKINHGLIGDDVAAPNI